MNRRDFLIRCATSIAALSISPTKAAVAPVETAPQPPLRWFAVGHDEMSYPYLARSLEEAIRDFAQEYDLTKGTECPECGELECREHLTPDQWDEPLDWIEEYSCEPASWSSIPTDRKPTNLEWLEAGYCVPCDLCDYSEPVECWVYDGKAICEECLYIARLEKLDRIIGVPDGAPYGMRETA